MKRLKGIRVLSLVILLLVGLTVGAYGASSMVDKEDKGKRPVIERGKNWEIRGIVKAKGMPKPKKNLKDTSDPGKDKEMIKDRPRTSEEALRPVSNRN